MEAPTDTRPLFVSLLAALLAMIAPAPLAAQVDPDDRCTAAPPKPNVACADPDAEPAIAALIVSVMATDNGASIHLTEAGVAHGRSCDGAAELVAMASDLYARLPETERLRDDLLWADPALTREVYAHAWAATIGSDRGNPVDVVFSDYIGDADSLQGSVYRGPLLAAVCPG